MYIVRVMHIDIKLFMDACIISLGSLRSDINSLRMCFLVIFLTLMYFYSYFHKFFFLLTIHFFIQYFMLYLFYHILRISHKTSSSSFSIIRSFLTVKSLQLVVNGQSYETQLFNVDIPQCFLLGPTLFLL